MASSSPVMSRVQEPPAGLATMAAQASRMRSSSAKSGGPRKKKKRTTHRVVAQAKIKYYTCKAGSNGKSSWTLVSPAVATIVAPKKIDGRRKCHIMVVGTKGNLLREEDVSSSALRYRVAKDSPYFHTMYSKANSSMSGLSFRDPAQAANFYDVCSAFLSGSMSPGSIRRLVNTQRQREATKRSSRGKPPAPPGWKDTGSPDKSTAYPSGSRTPPSRRRALGSSTNLGSNPLSRPPGRSATISLGRPSKNTDLRAALAKVRAQNSSKAELQKKKGAAPPPLPPPPTAEAAAPPLPPPPSKAALFRSESVPVLKTVPPPLPPPPKPNTMSKTASSPAMSRLAPPSPKSPTHTINNIEGGIPSPPNPPTPLPFRRAGYDSGCGSSVGSDRSPPHSPSLRTPDAVPPPSFFDHLKAIQNFGSTHSLNHVGLQQKQAPNPDDADWKLSIERLIAGKRSVLNPDDDSDCDEWSDDSWSEDEWN